ncbi:hypothetical protein Plec18170_008602 [Paecilomyces lecythidis]
MGNIRTLNDIKGKQVKKPIKAKTTKHTQIHTLEDVRDIRHTSKRMKLQDNGGEEEDKDYTNNEDSDEYEDPKMSTDEEELDEGNIEIINNENEIDRKNTEGKQDWELDDIIDWSKDDKIKYVMVEDPNGDWVQKDQTWVKFKK